MADDQREDSGRQIEEQQRAIGVVFAHQRAQAAVLLGALQEALDVRQRVEDDEQPGETQKADQEGLNELAQQIAVDDFHPITCWMALARDSMPRRISSLRGTPKLRRIMFFGTARPSGG